jgi:hypothetical protein
VNELNAYVPWLAVAIAAASLLYTIFNSRAKKNDERFTAIELKLDSKANRDTVGVLAAKLDLAEDKVTIIQNDLRHLPDKDVTHRLELAITSMGAELGKLSERVKPIANMADRMQEAMMEKVMS